MIHLELTVTKSISKGFQMLVRLITFQPTYKNTNIGILMSSKAKFNNQSWRRRDIVDKKIYIQAVRNPEAVKLKNTV